MTNSTHKKLRDKFSWYDSWHNHPKHSHVHWIAFAYTCVVVFSLLSYQIIDLYPKQNIAEAQATTTLGISGNRFTINGAQTFLMMAGYWDFLDASQNGDNTAGMIRDLDFLRSRGFNGIRVFPNLWEYNTGQSCNGGDPQTFCNGPNNNSVIRPNGSIDQAMFDRLNNLVDLANARGIIVDISFARETVYDLNTTCTATAGNQVMCFPQFRDGVVEVIRRLSNKTNVFYDLQNEFDHRAISLTVDQINEIKNSARSVDSNAILSTSGAGSDINFARNNNFDLNNFHFAGQNYNPRPNYTSYVFNDRPTYVGEPYHTNDLNSGAISGDNLVNDVRSAKNACIAAWLFHQDAGFQLSGGVSFQSQLNGAEANFAGRVNTEVNNAPWCGAVTPPSCTLRFNPTSVPTSGGATTAIWTSSGDADGRIQYSCNAGLPSGELGSPNGSASVNPTATATCTLTVINAQGTTATCRGTIYVGEPVPSATPNPSPSLSPTPQVGVSENCPIGTPEDVTLICDITPTTVATGGTVRIDGVALSGTIRLYDSNLQATNITGTVDADGAIVNFTVPTDMTPGIYTLDADGTTGIATSTQSLTILTSVPGNSEPPPPPFVRNSTRLTPPPASNFGVLINNTYNYAIVFVGIIVFLIFIWAGFLWLTSGANPGNLSTAKGMMTNAILGAILLISSFVILNTINPGLIGGSFNLGRIEVPPDGGSAGLTSRLLANNELGAATAIVAGCTIAVEMRDFTAVECINEVAESTGLSRDPILETTDTEANQQVGATTLQNGGNIGTGRRIVVLDTGYNRTHPELSSSYLTGWDFVNNDNDPTDDHQSSTCVNLRCANSPYKACNTDNDCRVAGSGGHGSHVAGIITSDGNVDGRSRGVAPGAQIIAGKVLDGQGGGYWSAVIQGIYWAVNGPDGVHGTADDFNADAISISIGTADQSFANICDNISEDSRLFARAIQYARSHGILTVIASGNFRTPNGVALPGCISDAFTVGAVDNRDRIAGFSGRGSAVDVVAPGVGIYSTVLGTNYGQKNGTSMAAPIVSGIAALLKSANPTLSVAGLEDQIKSMACDFGAQGRDNLFGWGRASAVPNSCTNTPLPTGVRGTITPSLPSCTKGLNAGNPNCDVSINYQVSNLTPPVQLVLRANNVEVQRIDCAGATCNGTLNFPNPPSNTYHVTLHLPNGNRIAETRVYIYTTGTLNSNYATCTQGNAANPNCNVTLSINATGIYRPLIKRDGQNWRLLTCNNATCNITATDQSPALGIHTYTLHDGDDQSRIARVIITVLAANPTPPRPGQSFARLCSDINYGGVCEDFSGGDMDLSNNRVRQNGAGVSSMRGYATLCTGTGLSGTCETFMSDVPDLGARFIGNDTVSSIRRGLTGGFRLTFCSEPNFGGTCQVITTIGDDSNLGDNPNIGNNSVSSMIIETTDIRAYADQNFGGNYVLFREGIYPDLAPYGLDNNIESYRD